MARKLRVLVAEDEEDIRYLIVSILESDGRFEVVGDARNGAEAVALAEELQPDSVLLDLRMPKMDGRRALPLIKSVAHHCSVVVLSAVPPTIGGPEAWLMADAYLEKHELIEVPRVLASLGGAG
jgi:CheY-like chemotaxis protein